MVIFCPNIGVLTSSVLALIPLVRPYAWQSLLLPVLPATEQMLDFLQARSKSRRDLLVLRSAGTMQCIVAWDPTNSTG